MQVLRLLVYRGKYWSLEVKSVFKVITWCYCLSQNLTCRFSDSLSLSYSMSCYLNSMPRFFFFLCNYLNTQSQSNSACNTQVAYGRQWKGVTRPRTNFLFKHILAVNLVQNFQFLLSPNFLIWKLGLIYFTSWQFLN